MVFLLISFFTLLPPAMSMTTEEESIILRQELNDIQKLFGRSPEEEVVEAKHLSEEIKTDLPDLEKKYFKNTNTRSRRIVETKELEDEVTKEESAPVRNIVTTDRYDGGAPVIQELQPSEEEDESFEEDLQ